jgi:CHASE2 domain-containing sensor protein
MEKWIVKLASAWLFALVVGFVLAVLALLGAACYGLFIEIGWWAVLVAAIVVMTVASMMVLEVNNQRGGNQQ